MAQEAGRLYRPLGSSRVPASSLRHRGPWSLSSVPFCHFWCGWHREHPDTLCRDSASSHSCFWQSFTMVFTNPHELPFPFPCLFLAVLALSWALGSTCFLLPQQWLPFVDPAASCVMWCVSLTADICLVCCGPSAGHCCPLEPSYCFTAGLNTRGLYLRFSIAAAFWYGAVIWNFLCTIWIW